MRNNPTYYFKYSKGISFYRNSNEDENHLNTIDNKNYTSTDDKYFYFNFNHSIMFSKVKFEKEYLYIEDKPIDFKWEITTDTLTINNILCKKATTNWQGFTTTAWFAESIPINAGPEKFNGLPGLIFKVQLPFREFILTEFKKNELDFDLKNPILNQDTISFDEFIKLNNEAIENLKKTTKHIEGSNVYIIETKKQ